MHFKVKTGFNAEDFISIQEDELEKAIYAQITGSVAIFKGSTVRGTMIQSITPDIHMKMGWNQGYKLGPEDMAEVGGKLATEQALIGKAKDNVQAYIASGRTDLIGKSPLTLEPRNKVEESIASLAEGMRLK